jgi:hypothetical protein
MIKVKCGSCNQTLGIPEKFAGKRILCPKCKASINVPPASKSSTKQKNIIKFRCPKCGQKIGLPPQYAGKKVQCAKCKNPLRVPAGSSQLKPSPPAQKESPQTDDFNPFADLPDANELLQPKPPAEAPLRLQPLNEPSKQGKLGDMAMSISSDGNAYGASNSASGFQIDNNLVALAAGVVFVILGGMAWGLVAKYAHMELGILAWLIGVLAGLGVYWFTTSRGILLGIAVALIALFGILCGKYFIAKWYFMPQFREAMKKQKASDFIDPKKFELSNEQIRKIMAEPGQIFGLVAMQLADDGEITKEDAEYFIMRKFKEAFKPMEQDTIDQTEQQKKELRQKEVEAMVYKCLAEWSEEKKEEVIKVQYPEMMKKFTDVFAKSKVMDVIGFAVAYIAAFSLFDLIWFPCAMVTAYKFGTGENS